MSQNLVAAPHPETSASIFDAPAHGAPTPPVAAEAIVVPVRARRPTKSQRAIVAEVERELAAHPEEVLRLTGGDVDPEAIRRAAALVAAWSEERERAVAWARFVSRMDALSWQALLALASELSPILRHRLAVNPEIGVALPAVKGFLTARTESSIKASRTRARRPAKGDEPPKP